MILGKPLMTVYESFVLQRAKKISVSGPILQAYAKNVA